MGRFIPATLLVLAWGSCTRGQDWSVEVLTLADRTLKDLAEDSSAGLRTYVNLTKEDLNLKVRVASCPTWGCFPFHIPIPVKECLMPVQNLTACSDHQCQVIYKYTTHCGCAEKVTTHCDCSDDDKTHCECSDEDPTTVDPNHCSEADIRAAHLGGKRPEFLNEQPDMVKIHIYKENERVSNLTIHACPVRCEAGLKLRKVHVRDREVVVGAVTVSWQDENCAFTECEHSRCVCDDDSDFDIHLRNFILTVKGCANETQTVPLSKLTKVLQQALNRCPVPTSTITTPTTTTTSPTTTTTTTSEPTMLPETHNIPVVTSGGAALPSLGNSTPPTHVAWRAAGSVVVVLAVIVLVILIILVIKRRQRRHRDSEAIDDGNQTPELSSISRASSKVDYMEDDTLL